MKSAPIKEISTPSQSPQPFFNKKGEASFLSSTNEVGQSFFSPIPGIQGNPAQAVFFAGDKAAHTPISRANAVLQTKLTINEPGDQYEQEADAMADQVLRMNTAAGTGEDQSVVQTKPLNINAIQRNCPACEQEEKVQRRENEEEPLQTKPLMRKSAEGGYTASPQLSSQLDSSKGGGDPLPRQTLGSMNQAFGADFSHVRIHTNSQASEMSQGIQAKAFTHGSDIYFNQGEYSPESSEGRRLLGHELTHVVQQGMSVERKIMRVPRPTAPADLSAYSATTKRGIVFDVPAPVPMSALQVHFNPAVDETPRAGFDIDYVFSGTLSGSTWLQKPLKSIARSQFHLMGTDRAAVLLNASFILPLDLSSFQDGSATPPTPGPDTRFRMTCTEFDRTGRGASSVRNVQIIIEDIGQPSAVPNARDTEAQRIARFDRDYGINRSSMVGFTDSDFNKLLLAMSRVPHHILLGIRDIPFERGRGSLGPAGEPAEYSFTRSGSTVTRTIKVYSNALSMNTDDLAFLMTHELGHAIASRPRESATQGTDLSAATGKGSFREAANLDGGLPHAITTYGRTNWSEYFSEAFTMYINHPDTLRILRPNVYQYFLTNFPMAAPAPPSAPAPTGAPPS